MGMKYDINDLKKLIEQNKSSDEIALYYNVSGRTIRNWLKIECLETNVKYNGCQNILNLSENQKKTRNERIKNFAIKKLEKRITCVCEMCKIEYKVKPSVKELGTRFCSHKCLYNFLFKTSPENHPRWLGGKTSENQLNRGTLEYNAWRINVYKKDFFTCQKCGEIGKNLNAHHINNWAKFTDERYLVDNGITLCRECHKSLHKNYGYNTTEAQLTEFLDTKQIMAGNELI